MIFKPKKPLTLDNIRELVSDESVFHWLLPGFDRVNKKFKVRAEDNSSAIIKYHNNILFFRDFGNTLGYLPWWKYLMEYNILTFQQALELIRDTFNLDLGTRSSKSVNVNTIPTIYPNKVYKTTQTIIRYRSREWGLQDQSYWTDRYDITKADAKWFKIIPCQYYWIDNGIEYRFKATINDPVYCYPIGNRRKIYRPLNSEGFKWTSNTTKDDIFGLHLLKDKKVDKLLIESSYKDTIVISKAGFYGLPTPSENSFLPEKLFDKIVKKGIKPILHFDNDDAGIKNAKIFSEKYNIPYITMPIIYHNEKLLKDPSDFVEIYGYEELKKIINQLINNI